MKLSVVLVGRNDDYGGDFKSRLERCVQWTHRQLTEFKIPSEIIFVNYNPLPGNPIQHFINWPVSNAFVQLRIITVPPQVHQTIINTSTVKNVPVLEYFAKNAGIRRSRGEFVLCINPDIIIPPEIINTFSALKKNSYYRADRYDYALPGNNEPLNADATLQLISNHVTRIWLKGLSYPHATGPVSAPTHWWYKLRSVAEIALYRLLRLFNFIWSEKLHAKAEYAYHCNVSGDFMLMHRSHWESLHGYHEGTYLALHVDALMVVQAATSGLRETVLSTPIYHQEHARRYDANIANPDFRKAYLYFQEQAQHMINGKKSFIYNLESWGLAPYALPEVTV